MGKLKIKIYLKFEAYVSKIVIKLKTDKFAFLQILSDYKFFIVLQNY